MTTALTIKTALGAYGTYSANAADFTFQQTGTLDYTAALSGNDLVLVSETAGAAGTVTFSSVADPTYGRTGDITYVIGANEYAVFGPFQRPGWANSSGLLEIEASASTIKLAVIKIV